MRDMTLIMCKVNHMSLIVTWLTHLLLLLLLCCLRGRCRLLLLLHLLAQSVSEHAGLCGPAGHQARLLLLLVGLVHPGAAGVLLLTGGHHGHWHTLEGN